MEKRFQMVADGIIVSALVVLTPTELEKLECKDLEKAINNIANDLHVKWSVEVGGDFIATATISKQFGPVVGDNQAHEIEIAATNFMRAVEHLELTKREKVNDDAKETIKSQLEFAKEMLKDTWEETNECFEVSGACIMGSSKNIPFNVSIGNISRELLRGMFEAFVKVHDHE